MNNKKTLQLACSPGTFGKIQADVEYRNSVAQQAVGEEIYDEIIFSPNPVANADDEIIFSPNPLANAEEGTQEENAETCMEAEAWKTMWLDAATKFLIGKVKELRPKVGHSTSLKTKKQMWSKIAEELKERGHDFNSVQVETKFFGLERQYKRMRLNNSKTGRNRQTCPFQSELDDLLREKKSLNPECNLDTEPDTNCSDFDAIEESNSSLSEQLDVMPSTSKKRKTTLQEYMEKREESDRKFQKTLDDMVQHKKERAEKKDALENRKVEAIESLINLLKK